MKTNQKNFVVDASIMRAAGDKKKAEDEGVDEISKTPYNCRKFLSLISDNKHKVVITEEIKNEWNKHQSRYSLGWRKEMTAKKLTFRPKDSELSKLDGLKNQIDNTLKTDIKFKDSNYHEAVHKDFHLVQAALASDKLVSSLDNNMKKILSKICDEHTILKTISWLNPDTQCEATTEWINGGCKRTDIFLIGQ